MTNGKVTSDLIDVEARGLAIPQLIQATSAKQYDVIMTAVIAIPPAAARGLELRVLSTALQQSAAGEGAGVWVKSDSPIKNPKELKGKSLGSYALRSTGYTQVRLALIHKYGLNAALEGGDLKQVEIQAPNLPGALAAGQIDAATLIHSQAFRALKSGEFRPIAETGRDNIEVYGMRFISALNVSYPERLAQRPDAFKEFNRMFRESVRYALAHRDEVFGAVGKQEQPAAGVLQLVVREELRRARHVRGRARQDHHEVLRAVERDRDDPELSRTSAPWSGSTRCAADGDDRHRAWPDRRVRAAWSRAGWPRICSRCCSSPPGRRRRWSRRLICCQARSRSRGGFGCSSPAARDLGHLGASLFHVGRGDRDFVRHRLAARADSLLRAGAAVRDRAPHRPVPQRVLGHRLDVAVDHVVRRHAADRDLRDQRRAGAVRAGQHVGGPRQASIAEIIEMAGSFTRRRWRMFALVIVPSLYPFIFATLRIMFGVAWKVTLTAELFGGNSGLGYMINLSRQEFDTATIFAAIILIIAFVHGMDQYVLAPLQASVSRHYAG